MGRALILGPFPAVLGKGPSVRHELGKIIWHLNFFKVNKLPYT
jgi:hypothetical protein